MKILITFLIAASILTNAYAQFTDKLTSNTNGWAIINTDSIASQFTANGLEVRNTYKGNNYYTNSAFTLENANQFSIQIEQRMLVNPKKFGSGIYLVMDSTSFLMYVNSEKYVSVFGYYDPVSKAVTIQPWLKVSYVHADDTINKLGIKKNGQSIGFYVNDVLVKEASTTSKSILDFKLVSAPAAPCVYTNFQMSPSPRVSTLNLIPDALTPYKPENLGATINTEYEEIAPMIAADGKGLYFVTDQKPGDMGGNDIYYSSKDANGQWQKGIRLPAPVNTANSNTVISISADNNTILTVGDYINPATGKSYPDVLFRFRKAKDGTWVGPEPIKIKNYYNRHRYYSFFVSSNLKVLLMGIQRDDTHGEGDLYASFSDDGLNYSEPLNLGTTINTVKGDFCPFLAADNSTLYFSSYVHGGYGNADIFVARRLDDTWTKWSTPQNLGPTINTDAWDGYFSIAANGEYGYKVSAKNSMGSNGKGDVFAIKLPESAKPSATVLVYGKVLNKKTNAPVSATVYYSDLLENKALGIANSDPTTGAYKIVLPRGKEYQFLGSQDGYYPIS